MWLSWCSRLPSGNGIEGVTIVLTNSCAPWTGSEGCFFWWACWNVGWWGQLIQIALMAISLGELTHRYQSVSLLFSLRVFSHVIWDFCLSRWCFHSRMAGTWYLELLGSESRHDLVVLYLKIRISTFLSYSLVKGGFIGYHRLKRRYGTSADSASSTINRLCEMMSREYFWKPSIGRSYSVDLPRWSRKSAFRPWLQRPACSCADV